MPVKENVLTRTDDFIKWFLPKIEKFPQNYKFLFGDRLVEIQFDVLENLIEAYYRKEKIANLRAANIGVNRQIEDDADLSRVAGGRSGGCGGRSLTVAAR